MKPDWSKAPEGATHHCSARSAWFKQDENDIWLAWQAYGRMHGQPLIGWCFCHAPDGSSVTARAWTGEGLPPVGIEIEAFMMRNMHDTYEWRRAKVVHGGIPGSEREILVFDLESTSPAWVDEFRPIRTPEQIAEQVRSDAIREMISVWKVAPTGSEYNFAHDRAAQLYDANFRKQPSP
ncbi:hypothetical protein C4K03_1275 [Pseudomonas synxantha]|uniref:Uncharacterized protein n=1 Tax=Pseudomonas synxantha TaxID=47883 RepID=A0A3G7U4L0_9PSED|nr:hypothetical protein [Pseudomonas synxantha]AZE53446.1 hypothetical protein C4K03_1275 [Pseudomonas synxantha]